MEGHVLAALAQKNNDDLHIENVELPVLALLISGGHTELVLMKKWLEYELIGQTRDDAVGEAFEYEIIPPPLPPTVSSRSHLAKIENPSMEISASPISGFVQVSVSRIKSA
jgi:N6-L-threonylcarbamoyladenine synthase